MVTDPRVEERYDADGIMDTFEITIDHYKDQLRIFLIDLDDNWIAQVKGVDWRYGDNDITFINNTPHAGFIVVIQTNAEQTQEVDFVPNDPLAPNVLEGALDKLTLLTRQAENWAVGALTYPEVTEGPYYLPTGADRAEKIVLHDSEGWPEYVDPSHLIFDVSAWDKTVENPPLGEALPKGELYLDGTDDLTSSKNRVPVVGDVEYVPAVKSIEGIDYTTDELKWAEKGTYGFFGDYDNVGSSDFVDGSEVTSSSEGSWIKVEATASITDTVQSAIMVSYSALINSGYIYMLAKKGNTNLSLIGIGTGSIQVNWANKIIYFFGTVTDVGSIFLSDEMVVIKVIANAIGTNKTYIYAREYAATSLGDYTYYKDIMVVDLDYPVPYVEGTHESNKLQYDIDWATSEAWTIEGWFKLNTTTENKRLFSTSDTSSDAFNYVVNNADSLILTTRVSSTNTFTTVASLIGNNWNHIKLIIQPTQYLCYVNGNLELTFTGSIPDLDNLYKTLFVGISRSFILSASGYIQDLRIYAGEDTSTDHYDNGLPYYNPDKTYGKNAMWSTDKYGNKEGTNQDNVIIQEYEKDGQHVTKWAGGRMELSYSKSSSFVINIAEGAVFRNDYTEQVVNYVEAFTKILSKNINFTGGSALVLSLATVSDINIASDRIIAHATISTSLTLSFSGLIIGTWK